MICLAVGRGLKRADFCYLAIRRVLDLDTSSQAIFMRIAFLFRHCKNFFAFFGNGARILPQFFI